MFVLKTLIDLSKIKKQKLYVCFLDLSKAFDSVWHNGLLYKLLKTGIGKKLYCAIKNMQKGITCCVKSRNGLTPPFSSVRGVRQGDVLSPLLFNLFVDDISRSLDKKDGVDIGDKALNCLMYADDIALVSYSREGLQNSMNRIYDYFKTWELELNVDKSAFVIFGSEGKTASECVVYGNCQIKKVKEYCYLGINFTSNGLFNQAQKCLQEKARKASFMLKHIIVGLCTVKLQTPKCLISISFSHHSNQYICLRVIGTIVHEVQRKG